MEGLGGKYFKFQTAMRILGWNYRGICNASTIRALEAQIRKTKSDIIFLCETKANVDHIELKGNIRSFDKEVVEAKGRAKGLCLLWRSDVNVEVIEFNKHLIAAKVSDSVCD